MAEGTDSYCDRDQEEEAHEVRAPMQLGGVAGEVEDHEADSLNRSYASGPVETQARRLHSG